MARYQRKSKDAMRSCNVKTVALMLNGHSIKELDDRHEATDETVNTFCGFVLICDGTNWFDCSHAKHV